MAMQVSLYESAIKQRCDCRCESAFAAESQTLLQSHVTSYRSAKQRITWALLSTDIAPSTAGDG